MGADVVDGEQVLFSQQPNYLIDSLPRDAFLSAHRETALGIQEAGPGAEWILTQPEISFNTNIPIVDRMPQYINSYEIRNIFFDQIT